MWTRAPSFSELVRQHWSNKTVKGDSTHRIFCKLKTLKWDRLKLNKGVFSDIIDRSEATRTALVATQEVLHGDPWNALHIEKERQLQDQYNLYSKVAHDFMVQHSKATWMQYGDANTIYFHSLMRKQKYKQHISFVTNAHGDVIEDREGIQ